MQQKTDYISPEVAVSLPGLFFERVRRSPNDPAYRFFDANENSWQYLTWRQAAFEMARWQQALLAENLQAGDRVALNLRNCKEWVYFDLAAQSLGLIVVPLYPDDRPDNMAFILEDADVKLVLLQSNRQWHLLKSALSEQHALQKVILQNPSHFEHGEIATVSSEEFIRQPVRPLIEQTLDSHKLASIIYTSGTTGRPKGVMLSHQNMLSVAFGALQFMDIYPSDLFLSFLPLSHSLERTAGYYLPIMTGSSVAYARSIPLLAEDLKQVQPTILIAVPRIFERIHDRLQQKLRQQSFMRRQIFNLAVRVGWQRFHWQQGHRRWSLSQLLWPVLNKLVVGTFKQRMGGRLRLAVTGGAPLPEYAAKLFIGLQLNLVQGYGLTETSPVISVNPPDNNKPASVGLPIKGVQVKIGEQQELLAKGPGNMLGYWNNHKATAQTIDPQGWLHTGDQAEISESGHIYITGRIKDILVLSNGEKVPPADMESAIVSNTLFEQALVVGEGQSYLAAVIVFDGEQWPELAQSLGLDPMQNSSLEDKKLHQYVIKLIREALAAFPAYARIRRVCLSLQPWTIENGLLTPTLKVKRAEVMTRYQREIAALFDGKD
ncbi:AMP-dependent synthetase/ligase [Methylophaga sp. OBS3]|uniref:AMP-dependent synthetase/ligase n=1 Tax=Methylophaga sp. OBS3 TaxID=2991934 RepID=UPI00225035EF|nr:long-chain fatty acid--CoA ligase [Methylophaga sp. OBS3]MCX4188946.1 long-chain fatty acid--CoA ligase [Methylophaga sp. OBS3]